VKSFSIIKYLEGKKTNIYAVCLDDSTACEFDKFLNSCPEEFNEEIEWLVDTIVNIKDNIGIRDGFFKDQGIESIHRFINHKDKKASIRVFCLKWGNSVIILGGGAIKDFTISDNAWQGHPELSPIVRRLAKIDKYISENQVQLEEAVENNSIFYIEG